MKKVLMTLMMVAIATMGKAMTYEQARNEALFLTDKMAYELNLNDEQYEAAYEINLDYLMGVTSYDDVYGDYWERRNRDLSYVLLDWQWNAFCAASYFFRPLTWSDGHWHFGIYVRYPHRDYFYFGRPVFYASYRGAHAWHRHGGYGYYYGHRDHFRPAGRSHFGMLDRWNRGDYRHHGGGATHHSYYGGNRHSSTRTTVHHGGGSFRGDGNYRSGSHSGGSHSSGSFEGSGRSGRVGSGSRPSGGSYSGGSYSGSSHSGSSFGGGSHGGSHGGSSLGSGTRGSSSGGHVGHGGSGGGGRSGGGRR